MSVVVKVISGLTFRSVMCGFVLFRLGESSVAQAVLELVTHLPQPTECWDYWGTRVWLFNFISLK